MKLIIAHIANTDFEPVRAELTDLGVLRMAISEVHSTTPRSAGTLRYRGAALRRHLRPELRLECVATDAQARAVIDVLRKHADPYGQVAVLELDEVHRERDGTPEFLDDPRLDAAAR